MYKLYGHKYARVNKRVYWYLFACLNYSLAFPVYSTTVAAVYADFINQLIVLPDENPPVDECTSATFFGGHVKYLPAADGTPTEPNDGEYWLAESAFGQLTASTFSPQIYTVTPSANPPAGGTFIPSGAQTTTLDATKTFTVAANSGYTRSNIVSGICPQGTWNGDVWTTGAITATCTVIFNFSGGPQLPTCTTVAASNVTVNSATLNGNVVSNSATATANFELGPTITYGTNVAATPSQVYSSTAVSISAAKTGLACNTTYHFRCKAVSSAGTGLGADQNFTTLATCPANAWIYPATPAVVVGKPLALNIHINSNNNTVGAYDFTVNFDATKLVVDTAYQNSAAQCVQGICPGSAALAAYNDIIVDNSNGNIRVAGFDTTGKGPGNDLQLLVMHFIVKNVTGSTSVNLVTNELTNPLGDPLGGVAKGVTVNISPGLCGDSDGNYTVNIVDALSISRKVVGYPPPPTINVNLADVNRDTAATIVDALHIARYSVGLVVTGTCVIGQPL